jgi:hypothetical protein
MLITLAPKRASISDTAVTVFSLAFGGATALLSDHLTDAFQRIVFFLNLLHRRVNEELLITPRPPTVAFRFYLAA